MTQRDNPPIRRHTGVLALMLTLAVATAAGCGGARNTLGTSASPCFRALPAAKAAVNNKGKLIGVRRYDTDQLQKQFPADKKLAVVKAKDLCLIAFKDTFQPSDVPLASSAKPGPYAVVATTFRHPEIVTAFILDHPPARFQHLR